MNPTGKGGFTKGISGNPHGRPKKAKEDRYYEILVTTCTKDEWKEIVKRAIYDAKRGDSSARKWLSDYLIGTPPQNIDLTTKGEKVSWMTFIQGAINDTNSNSNS